jgi:peptide/nickel transport system permease protein
MAVATPPTATRGEGNAFQRWWGSKTTKRFRRSPLAIVGAALVLFFFLMALFAPQLTATRMDSGCIRALGLTQSTALEVQDPLNGAFWHAMFTTPHACQMTPQATFSPIPVKPNAEFPLGTTSHGYDMLYGVIWGARTAFYEGVAVVFIALIVSLILGSLAGYFGGWLDTLLMRIVDIVLAFPALVLAIVIVTFLGASLLSIIIAIAAVQWAPYTRLLRGDILQVKEQEYVTGARALGTRSFGVIFKHVLPNSFAPLLIVASLDIGAVVLTGAALSFLGLGLPTGYADWGQMVSFAQNWILGPPGQPLAYWFVSFWPGVAIILFVLGWNLLGDAVRDVLDPYS